MEKLTKAQKNVLRLIFDEKLNEEEALKEAEISQRVYDGWFRQAFWLDEFNIRLEKCQRRADMIVSLYKETAAIKLITLTECDKEAVARQACLDILNMENEQSKVIKENGTTEMKPETQAAIMKIMNDNNVN